MATTILDCECDLVMKGGITSGVVNPNAINAPSRIYRVRQRRRGLGRCNRRGRDSGRRLDRQAGAQGPNAGMDAIIASSPRAA